MNALSKLFNWYFSKGALPYWCLLVIDYSIIIFSGLSGYYFVYGGSELASNFWTILTRMMMLLIPYSIGFRIMHTYSGVLRYSSFADLMRVIYAMGIGSILAIIMLCVLNTFDIIAKGIDWKIAFVTTMASTIMMCGLRVIVKTIFDTINTSDGCRRIFIYGVQNGGISLAKSIRSEVPNRFILKGFACPDPSMKGRWMMGQPVYIDDEDIVQKMRERGAFTLMVSPLQAEHFREQEEMVNDLIKAGIKIMMMPHEAEEWDGKSELQHSQLHEVDIEDLLPREKIEVDMLAIGRLLNDKRILITGAAGSIGSEMVRQVARFEPGEMILIDQAETPMHDIRRMMASRFPNIKAHTIVTSITNATHMEEIFRQHKPEYVFHAAAYKHVPMMEDNPAMAVQNNIYGTRVIADLAVKYGAKKFVMISTDKAVNPTNVMGCSKRICEIYCQSLNQAIMEGGKIKQYNGKEAATQFITTRFGNVLGSNGSVIPIFKEQIAKGGPVTVTHPDIIRFFMLIPEACRLVLEAGTMGKGGEIFVFDMGKPVRIVDLAQRMITLSGAKGVDIKFTGLRDGEKLYEEVLNDAELTKPTIHPKIMVAQVREYDYEVACSNEERLLQASYTYNDMDIVKIMKDIVPEFKSRHSKYEALD